MAQDTSTTFEGKLELLGILSFLSELADTKVLRRGGYTDAGSGNHNVGERDK